MTFPAGLETSNDCQMGLFLYCSGYGWGCWTSAQLVFSLLTRAQFDERSARTPDMSFIPTHLRDHKRINMREKKNITILQIFGSSFKHMSRFFKPDIICSHILWWIFRHWYINFIIKWEDYYFWVIEMNTFF